MNLKPRLGVCSWHAQLLSANPLRPTRVGRVADTPLPNLQGHRGLFTTGKKRSPPLPCPWSPAGAGAHSSPHRSSKPRKQPGTAPSPSKLPGTMVPVALTPFGPSVGERSRGLGAAPEGSPEHKKHLGIGNDQEGGLQTGPGGVPMALGVHVWTRLLEERLLPQGEPGTLGAGGGVVIVAVPGGWGQGDGVRPWGWGRALYPENASSESSQAPQFRS